MNRGFTLIELMVVMALMAMSALLVTTFALINRRSQLESSQLVKEVLNEIRYAQSLSKGVIWKGADADFRPKVIYSEISSSSFSINVENKGYGNLSGSASIKEATRKFQKQGVRIKEIRNNSGIVICSDNSISCDNYKLVVAFSVPRGEISVKSFDASPSGINFECPTIFDNFAVAPCKLRNKYSGHIEVIFVGEKNDEEIKLIINAKTGKMDV